MIALPWIAIFCASLAAWLPSHRRLTIILLLTGYIYALIDGHLGAATAIPIAALFIAAHATRPSHRQPVQYIGHAIFIVIAIALSLHLAPGFNNLRVIGPVQFTSDALPFTMYLNLDKPLVGFCLMLILPWIKPTQEWRASLKAGLLGMLITGAACLLIAVCMGLVRWEAKLPPSSWLWLLNNLLLVTLTEEAFFRGYVQGGLSRLLKHQAHSEIIAICAAAALFGIMHFSGGWHWMLIGTVAGIGYGLAYRFGGLQAAVIAHFGLNAMHFFLFTYPMLRP